MNDEKQPNYRFFVKPLSDNTNEQIATLLNARGDSAFTAEAQKIIVDGEPVFGAYLLPHNVLTAISKSVHHKNVKYYVQQGEGEVRPYRNMVNKLKRLKRSKAVKSANKALRMLPGR